MTPSATTASGRRRSSARPAARASSRKGAAPNPSRRRGPAPSPRRRAPRAGGSRPRGRTALRRMIALAALAATLAAGYFLWLRDSELVAVGEVRVTGVELGERDRVVTALERAGMSMTTLNVDRSELERVAARFATIASIEVSVDFPRGLEIDAVERRPALAARAGRDEVAVAGDGTVLPAVDADGLPPLEVERLPEAGRLEGDDLERALVLAAAPEPLAPLIRGVRRSPETGIEALMRGGVAVRFGSGANAAAKWAAAASVLADPALETAAYVDVRVPQRPAAGGAT